MSPKPYTTEEIAASQRASADADRLFERVAPLLAGQPPQQQAAMIALITARWLAGHFYGRETWRMRETLLSLHNEAVRKLIPEIEAELLEKANGRGHA